METTVPSIEMVSADELRSILPILVESIVTQPVIEVPVLSLETTTHLVEHTIASMEIVNNLVENLPVEEVSREFVNKILEESINTVIESANPLNTSELLRSTNCQEIALDKSTIPSFVPPHIQVPSLQTDQDVKQKISVLSTLVLELYRMLTSSLLILFVPQSCKGQLCSIHDNVKWNPNHHTYNLGICVNFITLFTFSCLYYIELKRENRLIKYLDVNPDMPTSNGAVEKTLEHISVEKKNKILSIDKQYQYISYLSIFMFVFNSMVSGIIVNRYYLGSQTTTSLITSLLFMVTKLLNVYQVCNTEEHIFYSSYIKTFVQFNDLDKKHKELL